MTQKHLILMLLGCALPLAALAAVFLFQVELSTTALWALLLLCPLSHLLMMGGHGRGQHQAAHPTQQEADHE